MDKRKNRAVMLVLAAALFAIPTPTYAASDDFLSYAGNAVTETAAWAWNGIKSFLSGSESDSASYTSDESDAGNMEVGDTATTQYLNDNLGAEETYTLSDGSTVQVRKKVLAAKIKQLESVNALTTENLDKAMLEIKNMEPPELEELEIDLAEAFAGQKSFKSNGFDLSQEDIIELNNAYEYTMREAVEEGAQEPEDSVTAGKVIEIMTAGNLSGDQAEYAAMTGILAAGALAGAAGAIKAAAEYKSKFEGNEGIEKSDKYWKNEKSIERSIPSFVKQAFSRAPVRGSAAYRITNPVPTNLTYMDGVAVDVISDYIAETNGSWKGTELKNLAKTIVGSAKKYGLDPLLVTCQLKQESGFCPDINSPVGACGIAQFMPETASDMGVNVWDVSSSIDGQCRYMLNLLSGLGNYSLALAGYNAGGGAVQEYGGIPPYKETQNYVSIISSMWGRLKTRYDMAGGTSIAIMS